MPERQPGDGAVSLRRDKNMIVIECGSRVLIVGEYNAWRIFGMLAVLLGIPLSKKVGKAIKL